MLGIFLWGEQVRNPNSEPPRDFADHVTPFSSGANAGGYCHRSELPDGTPHREVWFSDEFTPRHDWTYGGNNVFASMAIRGYCKFRCACAKDPLPSLHKNDTTALLMRSQIWNIVAGQSLRENTDGSMSIEKEGSQQSELQILPAQGPGPARLSRPISGNCRGSFCPQTWPTEILGDVRQMQTPPDATLIVKEPEAVNPPSIGTSLSSSAGQNVDFNITKCGAFCDGPQDCGKGDSEDECVCAEPSWNDIKNYGLSPVVGKSVCLVLALAATGISGRDLVGGVFEGGEDGFGLERRRYVDESGEAYQCRCNGTFVAEECCGSRDGMVWLG